jgi:hypothetical protein
MVGAHRAIYEVVALKPPSGVVMRIDVMSRHGLQGVPSTLHNKGKESYEKVMVGWKELML